MANFRRLNDSVYASEQLSLEDIEEAAREGFSLLINNRPDGEAEDQPAGADVARAAGQAGIAYIAIPVGHSGFSEPQVAAMADALAQAEAEPGAKVLAYCRSGTRSTFLWALAQASHGAEPAALIEAALAAGYDLTPIAPTLDMLAARAKA